VLLTNENRALASPCCHPNGKKIGTYSGNIQRLCLRLSPKSLRTGNRAVLEYETLTCTCSLLAVVILRFSAARPYLSAHYAFPEQSQRKAFAEWTLTRQCTYLCAPNYQIAMPQHHSAEWVGVFFVCEVFSRKRSFDTRNVCWLCGKVSNLCNFFKILCTKIIFGLELLQVGWQNIAQCAYLAKYQVICNTWAICIFKKTSYYCNELAWALVPHAILLRDWFFRRKL
jgi:hypothetical protein